MLNFFSYRSNYFICKEEVGGWGGDTFVLVLMLCCFPSYLIISSAVTYISRHISVLWLVCDTGVLFGQHNATSSLPFIRPAMFDLELKWTAGGGIASPISPHFLSFDRRSPPPPLAPPPPLVQISFSP